MDNIFDDIRQERIKQDSKWGVQRHDPFIWLAILGEEVGEVNRAVLENFWEDTDMEEYREELIQVAAVAVAAIQSFDASDEDEDFDETIDYTNLSDAELDEFINGKK